MYLSPETRALLLEGRQPETPSELNYIISGHIDRYLAGFSHVSYEAINEVIGSLECLKLELAHRFLFPRDDELRSRHGDSFVVMAHE